MHQSRVQLRSGVEGSDFCEEWQRPRTEGLPTRLGKGIVVNEQEGFAVGAPAKVALDPTPKLQGPKK